jgi:repressor LexA
MSPPTTRAKERAGTHVLRVTGDSMIEDAIFDGDFIVVDDTRTVPDGALAVILLDGGEVALRRFFLEPGRARLQPSNARYSVTYAPVGSYQVRGVVVGLVRRYETATARRVEVAK